MARIFYVALAEAKELAFQLRVSDGSDFGDSSQRARLIGDLDRVERMLNRLTAYPRAHAVRKKKRDAP